MWRRWASRGGRRRPPDGRALAIMVVGDIHGHAAMAGEIVRTHAADRDRHPADIAAGAVWGRPGQTADGVPRLPGSAHRRGVLAAEFLMEVRRPQKMPIAVFRRPS